MSELTRLTYAVDLSLQSLNSTREQREECERELETLRRQETRLLAEVHRNCALLTQALRSPHD